MADQTSEIINKALTHIAKATKIRAFMPEYRARTTDADALGLAIANWAQWDGDKIFECFLSALEDANFHPEHAAIKKMLAAA